MTVITEVPDLDSVHPDRVLTTPETSERGTPDTRMTRKRKALLLRSTMDPLGRVADSVFPSGKEEPVSGLD